MANIKSTRSLHIQNDQTDAAGVYQRNSGADLFMEAPGGIQQFTNFNDKVASSNDGEAPANAFTKSPYYDSVESIFGSPGLTTSDGRGGVGQTQGYKITDDKQHITIKKDVVEFMRKNKNTLESALNHMIARYLETCNASPNISTSSRHSEVWKISLKT